MLSVELQTGLRDFDLEVSFEVEPGSCHALAGPSGAGKTTVLRTVGGLHRPDRGTVRLDGDVWLDTERGIEAPPEARRCGFLFQQYALFPHLSAWRNVAYGLDAMDRGARRERAHGLLERLGVIDVADARPAALSGGERQRVALARALAPDPSVLLLDEPLSALDARTRAGASRELAAALAEAHVPAILVTHDFSEAAVLGDQIAILDRGRVVQQGTAAQLAAEPASGFVADFAGAVVLAGTARRGADGLTAVELDGGGEIRSSDSRRGRVAVSVYPWEISLEPPGAGGRGSALNRLAARVDSVTEVGNRVRVGLSAGQPVTAEVTGASVASMHLEPGVAVSAVWKATASRLTEL